MSFERRGKIKVTVVTVEALPVSSAPRLRELIFSTVGGSGVILRIKQTYVSYVIR